MSDILLLLIETDFVRLEIRGPAASSRAQALGISTHVPAFLDVESGGSQKSVECHDTSGALSPWLTGSMGPRFYEATAYRLIAVAKTGDAPPTIGNRDGGLVQNAVAISGQPIVVATLDFHEQVGLSQIVVQVGARTLRTTIEVFPTKLDYATDYQQLLHGVAGAARGLAFEYLRSTFLRGGSEASDHTTGLEWLTLLRNHVDALDSALRFIDTRPHRILHHTVEAISIDRVRGMSSTLRNSIAKGSGTGEWLQVPGLGSVRARLPAGHAKETLDTPEHRWLKHSLAMVRDRLALILQGLEKEAQTLADAGRKLSARASSEIAEVTQFRNRLDRLLDLPLFRSISTSTTTAHFASLTLLRAPGYSEAYQRLLALRLGLHVQGDALDLSTKELDVLYETWCFIRLSELLVSIVRGHVDVGDLLSVDASGIRVRLRRGQQSSISVGSSARELVLSYNRHFAGLTGTQKPDIVLEFRHSGWPEIIVVFDAKYRVDTSSDYLRAHLVPGPPTDAVNALHRYRDAIVLGAPTSPRGRPVVKGVALFPLSEERAQDFARDQPLYRSLEVLGIGALPFLPDCTALVETWLRELLQLSPEGLSSPGPSWLAHSHSLRESSLSKN